MDSQPPKPTPSHVLPRITITTTATFHRNIVGSAALQHPAPEPEFLNCPF
jgi:hypothetical protein